jgi:hypothetical protein
MDSGEVLVHTNRLMDLARTAQNVEIIALEDLEFGKILGEPLFCPKGLGFRF